MSALAVCIVVSLLGMMFIPAGNTDTTSMTKMIIAIVFIVLVWVLFLIHGPTLALA
jgi:hypothetical protein